MRDRTENNIYKTQIKNKYDRKKRKKARRKRKGVERNSEGKREKRIRDIQKLVIEDRWTQKDGKK